MTQVTQEKYDLVKQLLKTPLNNVEIGEIVELHGSTIGRIKQSDDLRDYKVAQKLRHEEEKRYSQLPGFNTQSELDLRTEPTVISELTRMADALDHLVEILER